jgi:cell division protein FtsI/penicillin-binding protein 2
MENAERVGSEKFYKYVTAFGFREKTGIDLPGEAVGIFHQLANLNEVELATSSFGQTLNDTYTDDYGDSGCCKRRKAFKALCGKSVFGQ